MGTRVLQGTGASAADLRPGIAAIQQEQGLREEFPAEVQKAAEAAVQSPRLPERDLTDLEFVTIDPPGAMDLDQALHLEADGDGYVVHYAIADVMAFLEPGDPVDEEAHRRGESLYAPDSKIPLHPKVLSEAAASLLPDQVRPAFVWTIRLDATGMVGEATVERALVRSRKQLDYAGVQDEIDRAPEGSTLSVLKTVGELRIAKEAERGGISLPMPAQEVDVVDGRWRLEYREMLPVESWNAQISLMTGFAAAAIMIEGKVGILRTLPPAPEHAVKRLRRTARALGIDWPQDQGHPEFIRSLDPAKPAEAAMVVACTTLLRGAGYAAFEGSSRTSWSMRRSPRRTPMSRRRCVGSWIATGWRPARRCVRGRRCRNGCSTGCPTCPTSCATRVVRPTPTRMRCSTWSRPRRSQPLVGTKFDAVVTEVDHDDERKGTVMIREPAVEAAVSSDSPLPVGEDVTVTLTEADPATRKVRFTL